MNLVTGANGFVGRRLVAVLSESGPVRGVVRKDAKPGEVAVGDIGADTAWARALLNVDVVFHVAARVHVMREPDEEALARFRWVNVAGTRRLAEEAVAAGVRRFVFVSSIKVSGDSTPFNGRTIRPSDVPEPSEAYARSKWEAEQELAEIAARTGLEVVVVRPPLIYGPGVGANFGRLVRLVAAGVPLPLGSVKNSRSLVGLDNLVSLLCLCGKHPAAAGRTFLVSDGEDLSTPELIRRIAAALGRPARLLPVPVSVLRLFGRLANRTAEVERLTGSLRVDITDTTSNLGWHPSVSVDESIRRVVWS